MFESRRGCHNPLRHKRLRVLCLLILVEWLASILIGQPPFHERDFADISRIFRFWKGAFAGAAFLGRSIKNSCPSDRSFSVITQHYRFFISADYLLPDMELQQKEQLQTQDQHEHADHQKRYVHQKQKAHPAYLLPQGKTPHQYGHSIFAGF